MPSRRDFLVGVAGGLSATAGCLGTEETVARCSSRGEGSGSQHLRRIAPIRGDEGVALGILVSERAVTDETHHAVRIRDPDDDLIASIPLLDNRDMSSLDSGDYSVFGSEEGELYAVPLGPPPVHGEFTVSIVNPQNSQITSARIRFNCYAYDGGLP